MNVTIIGAGNMAKGIGTRLIAGGNSVTLVDRTPEKLAETVKELNQGAASGVQAASAGYDQQLTGSVVVLAVPYAAAAEVIGHFKDQLADKIVVDISNPLNASYDGLVTPPDSSAAQEIAKLLPGGAKLVKAFNTVFAGTLLPGQVAGQPLDVFLAGDDSEAKKAISDLVTAGGMRAIDAGPLQRARELEAMAFLGISLQQPLGTNYMSAWKILS